MANPSADHPSQAAGASSELRRSVGQAIERIHEIIDAAERVAVEIRSDAELEAAAYLAERKGEADRLAGERRAALDQLTKTLADSAERFKYQAEQMLADLDQVTTQARAGVYESGALASVENEPEPAPELRPVESEHPSVVVNPYPGTGADEATTKTAAADPDQTSEALLRATQMAVTGKNRTEIVEVLNTDFPGVDADAVLDQILG